MKKELVSKIERSIEKVINGFPSEYIECDSINGEPVTIRISNHMANPRRMDENDISLVIMLPELEESDEPITSSMCIAKKEFRHIRNQHFLLENGTFEENFRSVGEMLDYYDIEY